MNFMRSVCAGTLLRIAFMSSVTPVAATAAPPVLDPLELADRADVAAPGHLTTTEKGPGPV